MNERSNGQTVWYCVLDRQCRMLYLGTDKSDAKHSSSCTSQTSLRSARRMGDAMIAAAKAAAMLTAVENGKTTGRAPKKQRHTAHPTEDPLLT
jgi:hypothetical protein